MYEDFDRKNRPEDCEKDSKVCKRTITKHADVSLPVSIKPHVRVRDICSECCGEPTITPIKGNGCEREHGCEFVVTQPMRVKIHLEFCAETQTGESKVHCKSDCGC